MSDKVLWDRWVDIGTSVRSGPVVPRMPDMSWLGDPPTEAQARRYEVRRAQLLADTSDED